MSNQAGVGAGAVTSCCQLAGGTNGNAAGSKPAAYQPRAHYYDTRTGYRSVPGEQNAATCYPGGEETPSSGDGSSCNLARDTATSCDSACPCRASASASAKAW